MSATLCGAKNCRNKNIDLVMAGVDLCAEHYSEISEKLDGVKSTNPAWLHSFAKLLKREDAEFVKSYADSIQANDPGLKEIEMTPTPAASTTKTTRRRKTSSTKSAEAKTTRKRSTKKTAAKKTASKKAAPKGDLRRRNDGIGDDVATTLRGMDSIDEMAKYALAEGANPEKVEKAQADFKGGVQAGLIRMRLGNMVRGAHSRAAAEKAKAPSKKKTATRKKRAKKA